MVDARLLCSLSHSHPEFKKNNMFLKEKRTLRRQRYLKSSTASINKEYHTCDICMLGFRHGPGLWTFTEDHYNCKTLLLSRKKRNQGWLWVFCQWPRVKQSCQSKWSLHNGQRDFEAKGDNFAQVRLNKLPLGDTGNICSGGECSKKGELDNKQRASKTAVIESNLFLNPCFLIHTTRTQTVKFCWNE